MAGTAFKDARVVAKITEGFTPVLVDFDSEKRLASDQGISTLPTIAYAMTDMDVIEWTQDYQEPDALLKALDEVLADIAEGDDGGLVDEE
jgi:hypothetical protein